MSPDLDWNGMPSSLSAAGAGSFSSRISELTDDDEVSVIAAAMASESHVSQ